MAEGIELLRCYAAERSEAAFAALVRQYLSLVYHAALRRTNGDAQLAEEVAQTVFASLARDAATLQQHAVLTGWLYVATRHGAANAMRTEQRRKAREREAHTMHEPTTPVYTDTDWEQVRPAIDCVIDELNEADRNAVLLRFFENRPYHEIGASLRITEDAARMRVDRALEKLRTLLGRRGIKSTAAALGGLLAAQSALAAPAGLASAVTGSALAGAGAAAVVTGTAGFIAFMTTNKIMMGIVGLVAMVAGGTAVYEFREARQAESTVVALGRDLTDLKSQLAKKKVEVLAAEEKRRVAEAQAAALAKSAAGAEAAQSGAGQVATKTGAAPKPNPELSITGKMDILYSNPEYVRLELERAELDIPRRYGPLYRRLGLSDAQIQEFQTIMLEQQQDMIDMLAAVRAKDVSLENPDLRQLRASSDVEGKMRTLLGTERYAAYKEFTHSLGTAEAVLSNLAMNLYATASPITPEQADRFSQVITANTPKPIGSGFIVETPSPDWPTIYIQAKDILSPSQFSALVASNRSSEIAKRQMELSDQLLRQAASNSSK